MPENDNQPKESRTELNQSKRGLASVATNILTFLVILAILIFAISIIPADRIVIHVQKENQLNFLQVFFQNDSIYSEENSVVVRGSNIATGSIEIAIPHPNVSGFRIDLGDKAAEIIIEKIELKRFLSTDIYLPRDLLVNSKPIQMIDKFEVGATGLVIHSTGEDPAFEFQAKKPSILVRNIQWIVGFILALGIYLSLKYYKKFPDSTVKRNFSLFLFPLVAALLVIALFYPGFMSYDTLHALRSARGGVTDSMWPPMVSYVWRVIDLISFNPSVMHFSQVFLLLFSMSVAVFFFTKKISYVVLFLLIYLSIPALLGTIAVIWKDVLMAAFFMAGFAVIILLRSISNRVLMVLLSLLAIFLIFLGICSRHNAITGAVPLFFYLAFVVCSRIFKRPISLWLCFILLGSVLTGTSFLSKSFLDNYSLPGFSRLSNSNEFFMRSVQALDVAGASVCVGRNLFGDVAPNLSISEIEKEYDPRHINLSKNLLSVLTVDKRVIDPRISQVWFSVALNHPICFFNNKFQLTKYLIGANYGPQFIITQPSIDENEYGYSLAESSLRDATVTYIVQGSSLPFFRPWFLYIISVISLIYLIRARAIEAGYLAIFLSALFYFGSLVLFGNAADARLPFYTTSALLLFVFLSVFEYRKERRRKYLALP